MRSFLRLWHRWWLAWSSCEWIWGNKKAEASDVLLLSVLLSAMFYLPWCSLETVSDLRPFLRRALSTRRPLAVCIRRRNPCLLILFLLWGWNVLFIVLFYFLLLIFSYLSFNLTASMPQHLRKTTAKLVNFGKSTKEKTKKHQVFLSF